MSEKTDSEKLLTLADWIDLKYPNDKNPEVQIDLRKIATHLSKRDELITEMIPYVKRSGMEGAHDLLQRASSLSTDTKPDYSDWYNYKGEVDFKDGIRVKFTYNDVSQSFRGNWVDIIEKKDIKRYRIKLDGVKIIKYNNEPYLGDHIIGHDPFNKIKIIKDV